MSPAPRGSVFPARPLRIVVPATPPEADNPGVPAPPPLFFLGPFLALWALELVAPTRLLSSPWRWAAAALLVAAGVACAAAGAVTQRRAGTDFLPDRPSTRVVSHGVYARTRNPMYLGFAVLTGGLAVAADSAWALLAVPVGAVLVDRLVIAREERYLARKFGEEYLSYKRRVRRWL